MNWVSFHFSKSGFYDRLKKEHFLEFSKHSILIPLFLSSLKSYSNGLYIIEMPQSGLGSMQGSSYTKSRLPPKVVLHPRSYSTDSCLPLKVIFHRRSSSTDGCLPLKVAFHQRLSSTEGCLPLKVVLQQRSSSTKGHLLQTITPWLILY